MRMRGKKRPPEERVSSVTGPLPPCRVCGDQAAGFHYGVNTCEACKGFFRRSLLRNCKYECLGGGNCVIGTNRRKSCPKCRYRKCLSVGMSKEAIKTGRYTYVKRTQDILELKMIEQAKQSYPGEFVNSHSFEQKHSPRESKFSDTLTSVVPECTSQQLVFKSEPPSAPTTSLSLPELMPNLSTELMSASTCVPLQDSRTKLKLTEDFKAKDGLSQCAHSSNFAHSSEKYEPDSPLCSTLLSPLSIEKHCEYSPSSQRAHQSHDAKCTETSPFPSYSPLPSPMSMLPSMQKDGETSLKTMHSYNEAELDDFISVIVSSHKMLVEDSNSITDEVLQVMFKECKERCSLQTEIFGHMGTIHKDEHDQIYTSTGLDIDGRLDDLSYAVEKMDIYIRQMIAFMKLIPGFRALCLVDQTALVKASIYDLFLLGYFRGYNKEEFIVVEPTRSYCRHQMEVFQTREDLDRIFNISHRLQNLHLTFDMVIVLKALCLFFTDRVSLKDASNIEQLQLKIVQCLLLMLERHFPDKSSIMFAKIISVLAQSRNYAEDCHKFIVTNMFTGSYMERFHSVPILFELFSASISP